MKKIITILLFANLVFAQKKQVDLLVHHAQVYTVDAKFSKADAFVVHDGVFLEVGNYTDLAKKYSAKSNLDLQNKPVYPGFRTNAFTV
jgi:predicted amidohydrolase YtcJ